MNLHLLFLKFSCGDQCYNPRASGGGSDWNNCLCDSCQPYDAVLTVGHSCRGCAGSMSYPKEAPETRLTQKQQRPCERCATHYLRLTFRSVIKDGEQPLCHLFVVR